MHTMSTNKRTATVKELHKRWEEGETIIFDCTAFGQYTATRPKNTTNENFKGKGDYESFLKAKITWTSKAGTSQDTTMCELLSTRVAWTLPPNPEEVAAEKAAAEKATAEKEAADKAAAEKAAAEKAAAEKEAADKAAAEKEAAEKEAAEKAAAEKEAAEKEAAEKEAADKAAAEKAEAEKAAEEKAAAEKEAADKAAETGKRRADGEADNEAPAKRQQVEGSQAAGTRASVKTEPGAETAAESPDSGGGGFADHGADDDDVQQDDDVEEVGRVDRDGAGPSREAGCTDTETQRDTQRDALWEVERSVVQAQLGGFKLNMARTAVEDLYWALKTKKTNPEDLRRLMQSWEESMSTMAEVKDGLLGLARNPPPPKAAALQPNPAPAVAAPAPAVAPPLQVNPAPAQAVAVLQVKGRSAAPPQLMSAVKAVTVKREPVLVIELD